MKRTSRRLAEEAFSSGDAENEVVRQKSSKKSRKDKTDIDISVEDEVPMYDIIRQRNIEVRERLFNELKIGDSLNSLTPPVKDQKAKASNRGLKKPSEPKVDTPSRKSLRLQKIDAETGLQLPEKEPTKYVVRS
jgi:hypothetical protein